MSLSPPQSRPSHTNPIPAYFQENPNAPTSERDGFPTPPPNNNNLLQRQLENQAKTIQAQADTINRTSTESARLREEINEGQQQIVELEEEVATLRLRDIQRQRLIQHPEIQTLIHPTTQLQNNSTMSCLGKAWESFRSGVVSVGRFCRRHRRLIEASTGIAGIGLYSAYPSHGVAIALGGAVLMAFFDWLTSFFE